jgi:hypothetical protein
MERAIRNGDERAEWFRKDPSLENIRRDGLSIPLRCAGNSGKVSEP